MLALSGSLGAVTRVQALPTAQTIPEDQIRCGFGGDLWNLAWQWFCKLNPSAAPVTENLKGFDYV